MTESMIEDRGQNAASLDLHPYLKSRTWYPMAETWDPKFHPLPPEMIASHLCTFAQAPKAPICTFAPVATGLLAHHAR